LLETLADIQNEDKVFFSAIEMAKKVFTKFRKAGQVVPFTVLVAQGDNISMLPLEVTCFLSDESKEKVFATIRAFTAIYKPDTIYTISETWTADEECPSYIPPRLYVDKKESVMVLKLTKNSCESVSFLITNDKLEQEPDIGQVRNENFHFFQEPLDEDERIEFILYMCKLACGVINEQIKSKKEE
jgi:hypothetical protein